MSNPVRRFRSWLKPRLNIMWMLLFAYSTVGTALFSISLTEGFPWWLTAVGVISAPVVAMSMADILTGVPASTASDGEKDDEEDLLEYSQRLQQEDAQ